MFCRLLVRTFPLMMMEMSTSVAASAQVESQSQASELTGVYRQGAGVVIPKLLHSAKAAFTDRARTRRVSGVLRCLRLVRTRFNLHGRDLRQGHKQDRTASNAGQSSLHLLTLDHLQDTVGSRADGS
jgi:hypothetical protein